MNTIRILERIQAVNKTRVMSITNVNILQTTTLNSLNRLPHHLNPSIVWFDGETGFLGAAWKSLSDLVFSRVRQ